MQKTSEPGEATGGGAASLHDSRDLAAPGLYRVECSTHQYRPISPSDEAGVSATYGLSWPRSMAGMVIDELPNCYCKKDSRSIIREWSFVASRRIKSSPEATEAQTVMAQ